MTPVDTTIKARSLVRAHELQGGSPGSAANHGAPNLRLADWCVLDFDPKDGPFDSVITLAGTLKRICDQAACSSPQADAGACGSPSASANARSI